MKATPDRHLFAMVLNLFALSGALLMTPTTAIPQQVRFIVKPEVLHELDDRLFGQFLERASFGEPGPEKALIPGTRKLQPKVVELMKQMRIPIIRFPGGTDADYIDWRDMISNVPNRNIDRPVSIGHSGKEITNNFGLDEFLALRDELGSEAILVVNLLDVVREKRSVREGAALAAGLVAYCNAPLGTDLPDGIPDWPAVRARNGHPEPYKVKCFQIGNEIWKIQKPIQERGIENSKQIALTCIPIITAYIDLMREVDPSIEIIIDGPRSPTYPFLYKLVDHPEIRKRVDYLTFHSYGPYAMDILHKNAKPYPHEKLSPEEFWKILVATPGDFCPLTGLNIAIGKQVSLGRAYGGYKVACTEWNWNGYGYERINPRPKIGVRLASGIGAAGFLHGLMRNADLVKIATQSMLVGTRWGLNNIRADPEGKTPAYLFPTGQVAMFYSRHHGANVLDLESLNVPSYEQPYKIGGRTVPKKKVAYLDPVVTASGETIYFHVINRHFTHDIEATIDLTAIESVGSQGKHQWFTGRVNDIPNDDEPAEVGWFVERPVLVENKTLTVALPARSVSIIEIPRR